MNKRRLLAFVLALMMTSTMVPTPAMAQKKAESPEAAVGEDSEAIADESEATEAESEEEVSVELAEESETPEVYEEGEEPEGTEDPEPVVPVTATVTIYSDMLGSFLHAPAKDVEVSSNLAESYGYTDGVAAGTAVSALDCLVKAHEIVFGEAFTAESAEEYLTLAYGSPSMQFAIASNDNYGGFWLNDGYPNDGTAASYGTGYNGTTVTTQPVVTGDVIGFTFYDDVYNAGFNWLSDADGASRTFTVNAGEDLELTLKTIGIWTASNYLNAAAMWADETAEAVEDAQLYTVNEETGALTAITDAVTDEDGKVTLNFTEAGTYTVVAYEEDANLMLMPTVITVEAAAAAAVTATVDITSQMGDAFLHAPAKAVEVSSDLAESYGFTETVPASQAVTVLDVLVKAHELVFGEAFTAETAADYLTMSYGSPSKQFGVASSTYYGGFWLNGGYPTDGTVSSYGGYNGTLVGTQTVEDGDDIGFFFYEDELWADSFNWFEGEDGVSRSFSAYAGQDLTLTMKSFYASSGYLFATPEDMFASENASAAEEVQLYTVDPATGALTAIDGAITDEDGQVTLNFAETGTYTIAGYGTEDCESRMLLMTAEIVVEEAPVEMIEASFYANSSYVKALKVYAMDENGKTGEDLLKDIERVSDTYSTSLPAGQYLVEGYYTTDEFMGSIVVEISEDSKVINLVGVIGIKASNSGWVLDTDYTLSVAVEDKNVNPRTITTGKITQSGTEVTSCIAFSGDTVKATFTPTEAQPGYLPATKTVTVNYNTGGVSVSCPVGITVTITAPEGSVIDMGTLTTYYVYTFAEASTVTSDENGVTAVFNIPKSTAYFYRVQNPDGVTYWNYNTWSANADITITAEDLGIGDASFSKDTVYHNYEQNKYDKADIYLNVNKAGYKNLAANESFELNVFRNWFAVESYMNAKVALPDAHYQVINVDGGTSDVVTVTPNEKNSNVATVTANHAGTAIVLVTYDAMTHMQGMTSNSKKFSAIWPECTGVFVVTVGADGTSVATNMTMDRTAGTSTALDAEHDILFYTGDAGASYSFKPESGCTVTVARSTVTDKMTFSGFTASGVDTAEDGTVTVSGLTGGRHIIRVEKGGVANYQVITARQVTYKLLDASGNELTAESEIRAGDTIKVQFTGLINPAEKLSGVYNFNASLYYVGEDGTTFKSNPGGSFGVYDFSGNPERQIISITIPKFWGGSEYTLNGVIKMGGFGSAIGAHRGITYAKGSNPNFNAESVGMTLSQLPELTIALAETDFINAKINLVDENGTAVDRTAVTISMKDAAGNIVVVADDGTFSALEETFYYEISGAGYRYASGSVEVTDTETEFTITLTTSGEDTWNGTAAAEPSKDENGVYQISKASELAWLAAQVNARTITTFTAVLTQDIDLGDYSWTAINTGGYSYSLSLDGQGHRIDGLNTAKGLFGTLGGTSKISNLTVAGKIVTTSGSAGAIAGYLQKGTIENCISEVNITGTGSSQKSFGGIAGYTYNGSYVRGCINKGDIQVEGTQVGGIVGYVMNTNAAIENCYNTGNISGSAQVGGIVGNTVTIPVTGCYSTGTITGGASILGQGGAVLSNCYYLNTQAEDELAEALTETQLKSADLGDAYVYACGRYPALSWETGITVHEAAAETTVVAPLCTEKGYTLKTCTKCGESYMDTYTAALGHDWCENTDPAETCDDCVYTAPACEETGSFVRTCRRDGCVEPRTDVIPATGHTEGEDLTVYPAYVTYTCPVCGEFVKAWNDDRLEHMALPMTLAENINMTDDGSYGWTYDEETGAFCSTNQAVDSSTSASVLTFTLQCNGHLSFDYSVSSESNYDKMTIQLTPAEGDAVTIADGISGRASGSYDEDLAAGTYTLRFAYKKDSSSASGTDTATVSNIRMTAAHTLVLDAAVAATCTTDGLTAGYHCSGCTLVGKTQTVIPATGHTEEVKEAAEATCTVDGYAAGKICSVCGEILEGMEAVPATGHTYEIVEATEATCTEPAKTTGLRCSVCGEVVAEPENVGEALGHDYQAVVTPPTSEAEGYTTYTCTRCDDSFVDDPTEKVLLDTPVLTGISNKNKGVTLTWNAVEGAANYAVFRKTEDGAWGGLAITASATYVDTTAESGTTYTYTVSCLSSDGSFMTSGFDADGLTIQRLSSPVLVSAISVKTGVQITWEPVTGAVAYRVYRKFPGSSWTKVGSTTDTTFVDTKGLSGKTYTYTVACETADGTTRVSSYNVTGLEAAKLAKPELVSAANKVAGVEVKWNAVAGAAQYRILRKVVGGNWKIVGSTAETTFVDETGVSGKTYIYTVACLNEEGTERTSYYNADGLTIQRLDSPVASLKRVTGTGISVTWTEVKGATGYVVYRKTGDGKYQTIATVTDLTWVDTTAVKGTTYSYAVRATSDTGRSSYAGKKITY